MTDFQTLTLHQPALAALGEAVPYLRLVSGDGRTIADAEYSGAGEDAPAQVLVAVIERDAADIASPVVAGVFDVESGALQRFGQTVSASTRAGRESESLAVLVEAVKELVACPATHAK